MNGSIKLSLVAVSLLAASQLPANALNLNDVLRSYTGVDTRVGTDRAVPNQTFVDQNIQTRLSQLSDQLRLARSQGKLTMSEQLSLQAQLDDLSARARDMRFSGGYSYSDVTALTTAIESFGRSLDQQIAANPIGGRVDIGLDNRFDSRFGYNNGIAVGDNFEARLSSLRVRIDNQARRHLLTWDQRRSLNNSISWISRMEQRMLSDDGRLTRDERHMLEASLDRISDRLNTYVAENRGRFY